MKQIKKTKKQESGRSMIEMVGVLAVMGLITAGAFVLITSAMRSQKISRVDDDVSAIVAGTRLLYNSQENFNGLNNTAIEALGFSGKNPFGGDYFVSDDGTKGFYVGISGLSANECSSFVNRNFPGGSVKVSGCSSISASNGVVTWTCDKCADKGGVQIQYNKVQE